MGDSARGSTMNNVEKAALLVHRDAIVQNVDFTYIKDKLLAYGVLNSEALEDVDSEKTKSAKVRKLLDLLPRIGGRDTFTTFVRILEVDYDWIAEKLSKCNNRDSPDAAAHSNEDPFVTIDNLSVELQQSLLQGGIPFPPPHLVPRSAKIAQIRECLKEISHGQFVVLHGMAGAGKSVLAAESVRDIDIMKNTFGSHVYWLTVGQTDKDTLLTKMQALCEKLDHTVLPPLSVDQATERLRRLMADKQRKNCLLILDDVWRGEVVRAFDFGCRILMTTRDASVTSVVQGRAMLIKVQDGFTQEESMTYLADCLNITEHELPEQADQMYSESKGSPMVLSLLAPLLAERGGSRYVDAQRWEHYLGKLRDRKYTQLRRNGPYNYETINEAIAISFHNLDEETRRLLNDFVIFLDDVNIPAAVLQVLWQCSRYEMEERISVLVEKSLIAQHIQEQSSTCTVLYGVHDLLLDYLKSQMSAEEQKLAHRKLIDSYMAYCNQDFGSLPDDNYIFWFLGYHLYKAEYTELFQRIFLNLSFVSAKLRSTGPSDLLNDFRKYQDYISGTDGENFQRVLEYTHFVRTCGHIVVQCRTSDIIQLALHQPKDSAVYRDALAIAKMAKDRFYLECGRSGNHRQDGKGQVLRSTVLNYGHVTAACFAQDGHRLLSAISDGQIRLWDVDSGKELHRFTGHNGSVHQLSLSSDANRFVSASADGSAKVWDLSTITRKLDGISLVDHPSSPPLHPPCILAMDCNALLTGDAELRPTKTPSPRMRQDSWHNMFDISGRVISDNSITTYAGHTNEVLSARFSENGALVVSCGLDRTARVWLSTASMEIIVLKHPEPVTTCCFSDSGFYVATGCTDSSVRIWSVSNEWRCVALFHEQVSCPRILFVSFKTDNSLISVSDTEITILDWSLPPEGESSDEGESNPSYSIKQIDACNGNCCYQSAAVSDNKRLLAVATSKDNILLYNLDREEQIYEFPGHSGSITSLYFSPDANNDENPNWLLSGSLDETLKVWNVSDCNCSEDCSLSCSAFHGVCPPNQPGRPSFVIATVRSDNRIQVINGSNDDILITKESDSGFDRIEHCIVSHRASMMAWTTMSGHVKLMSFDKSEVKQLGFHTESKIALLRFSPSDVLLLTASSDGCIKLWKPKTETVTIGGPKRGVVDCFFVDSEKTLVVCGADGTVKLWSIETGNPVALLLTDLGLHVTFVDLASDHRWLAQGTTLGIQLSQIQMDLKKIMRQPMRLGQQSSPVRVCRFASNIQYLAVGYDSGIIEVLDYSRYTVHVTLVAHQSWVRDLRWCHSSPFFQLVSVGDRIAWWNVNSSSTASAQRSHQRASLPLTSATPDTVDRRHSGPLSGRRSGLVQTVEFQTGGRYASKLFVSIDGRHLITASDSGVSYILRQLQDN